MKQITTVGTDLAKSVFTVHGGTSRCSRAHATTE